MLTADIPAPSRLKKLLTQSLGGFTFYAVIHPRAERLEWLPFHISRFPHQILSSCSNLDASVCIEFHPGSEILDACVPKTAKANILTENDCFNTCDFVQRFFNWTRFWRV